jgi:hypothetical protein
MREKRRGRGEEAEVNECGRECVEEGERRYTHPFERWPQIVECTVFD